VVIETLDKVHLDEVAHVEARKLKGERPRCSEFLRHLEREKDAPLAAQGAPTLRVSGDSVIVPHTTLSNIYQKLEELEDKVQSVYELATMISQAYYWTPEWQKKEKRADEDVAKGRSKLFESAEDLIKELRQ